MEKRLIKVDELATMFGLSAKSLRNKLAKNAARPFPIRPIRVGGAIRFDMKDVEAFLELQKSEGGDMPPDQGGDDDGGAGSMPDLPGETVAKKQAV